MIEALQFSEPSGALLQQLDETGWRKLLLFCDRYQLTLPLGLHSRAELPHWVRDLIADRFADNATRWTRIQTAYNEISQAFTAERLEFLVLKGFSNCPDFIAGPRFRCQHDLDLLLPPAQILYAREAVLQLGYQPIGSFTQVPVDHLPTMIRKTGWEWRGNYFDPDLPVAIELHFRFWDPRTERIDVPGLDRLWDRRQQRQLEGLSFTALDPFDAIAYSSLHLLRHLFRGDVSPFHVYEIASFLENKADAGQQWRDWTERHEPEFRTLQCICFALAQDWFQCRLNPALLEEIARLPAPVQVWLTNYGRSPLASLFKPNKDELWLHLSLLKSLPAKAAVLRRRLIPLALPGPVDAVHLGSEQITLRIRLRSAWRYLVFLCRRFGHHTRTLPGLLVTGSKWSLDTTGLTPQYWRFFLAAGLFDFGLFIYFLLYNLYLLQLGFGEQFIGLVSSVMLAGSIAGSIPAGVAIQRFGLKRCLIFAFFFIAVLSTIRANLAQAPLLLALAFLAGLVSSIWPVALAPAIALLTNERNRSRGFSLVFSSGIGIGILGGIVGGRLPGFMARFDGVKPGVLHYREALEAGCAIVVLGGFTLRGLVLKSETERTGFLRPPPSLTRFLIASAVWNLGTGSFNPFFSTFFARLHVPVETIGVVFSGTQLAQVGAILVAPALFRRFGLIRGISGMQVLTGVGLLTIAAAVGPLSAATAYAAFMVFQYMSEPGTYSLLMDLVPHKQRSAASALAFLIASSAQAVAAALAGAIIERAGYTTVLIGAAILCVAAGLLFRMLLGASRPLSGPDTA